MEIQDIIIVFARSLKRFLDCEEEFDIEEVGLKHEAIEHGLIELLLEDNVIPGEDREIHINIEDLTEMVRDWVLGEVNTVRIELAKDEELLLLSDLEEYVGDYKQELYDLWAELYAYDRENIKPNPSVEELESLLYSLF